MNGVHLEYNKAEGGLTMKFINQNRIFFYFVGHLEQTLKLDSLHLGLCLHKLFEQTISIAIIYYYEFNSNLNVLQLKFFILIYNNNFIYLIINLINNTFIVKKLQ